MEKHKPITIYMNDVTTTAQAYDIIYDYVNFSSLEDAEGLYTMPEESYITRLDILTPERAAQLLKRQEQLQRDARVALEELALPGLLTSAGSVRMMGSLASGLMVWRDIDLSVYSPRIAIERVYEVMLPMLINSRIVQGRYLNESGSFNSTGLPRDERYYFTVLYRSMAGDEWKLDISFWLMDGAHPEPVQDVLEQGMSEEMRLAILWIKDVWYRLPAYRIEVASTDIYDAVLQHHVRTPAEFNRYLAERGKPVHEGL
ncbi:MAG TPA: hypothetical protein VH593_27000 [Ktedonobacteraceae bacterium]|jgi:hypothetical protein